MDLLHIDEEIFHRYEESDLLELDDTPLDNVATDAFDGYSFIWHPEEDEGDADDFGKLRVVKSGNYEAAPVLRNIRSILKSPSPRFQEHPGIGESICKQTDFLDLNRSATRFEMFCTPDRRRKLRKKRSSVAGASKPDSIVSKRKSVVSLFSVYSAKNSKSKEAVATNQLSNFEASVSSNTLNLPKGIVQSGKGIGFTYTPPASRSHLSLASVASTSCFGKLGVLINKLGKSSENLPKSRTDVMQQIYGSTWSISQTEARMSTVTFGIPDGLGRRVDSNEILPGPSSTATANPA